MRVSVIIPTYNAEQFIGETLESVLAQTVAAEEVVVLDDGSTDGTLSVVRRFSRFVTTLAQDNQGVARARNRLCALAQGELIAFLDHDDVWHPRYLEIQSRLCAEHPCAVAFFTGHLDFHRKAPCDWPDDASREATRSRLITRTCFLLEYTRDTGNFASMSYCCIPKRVLARLGSEPFCPAVSGADDFCLFSRLPLVGPVAHTSQVLVAYRISPGAQSNDELKNSRLAVDAFQRLHPLYASSGEGDLRRIFEAAFASKCRQHAKVLLGLGRRGDARQQLLRSIAVSANAVSRAKSSILLTSSFLPAALQPAWPPAVRAE